MTFNIQKKRSDGTWQDDPAKMGAARILAASLDRDLDKTVRELVEDANEIAGTERYRAVEIGA